MRQNILRYAMTERKILSTVNHPFIVKLRYAFQTHEKLYLVMDYCPGGDLLALIKKFGVLEEHLLRKYMAEIVLAIEALHRAEIIYRDLKPSNIIIDSDGHACLTDFGLSKEAALAHSFCGSTAYLAPEMLWRRGHTKVLDWYLLGVVIYECLTGRPPFWDSNKEQLLANIKSGRYKPLGPEFSKEVRDLVEKVNDFLHSCCDQIQTSDWE
jgi:serine/threonine protein kinase